ncbi:unnamed protein product [Schistosoma margrebowiei]|uniref:Uncharacterized protein n=1 Tax=Schistosoma margrebowiei TaxID=48269 RepID=A0A183MQA6_9TREM|nr:unnamed protein product [Schistosoma margrebowiei]
MVEPTGTYIPAIIARLGHHSRQVRPPRQGSSFDRGLVDMEDPPRELENRDSKPLVNLGSRILREKMANGPIIGHRQPWDCIPLRCSTALWIRPLGQRLGEWLP